MRQSGTEIRTWTPKAQAATIIVAASNSLYPERADYVCPGAADDVVLQAALDELAAAGGGKLLQLPGKYNWTSAVTYSESNLEWEGAGKVVNDCSAVAVGGALKIEGAITGTNSALTGDAAKGQKDVTVADASSFSAGDWIRIRSEALFNSGLQHLGEIQKIASIAGNVITCEDMLAFAYDVADTGTVDLLTMYENIQLKNMHFIGSGVVGYYGFLFRELHNVLIENLHWADSEGCSMLVYDIVGLEVRGYTAKDSAEASWGYGVGVYNASRDVLIHHSKFYNCRHGIACAGDSTYGVQTNQVYDSNTFRYSARHMGAIGPHNTYDGLVISNNIVMNDGLGYVAGTNSAINGNTIYNDVCAISAILVTDLAKNVIIQGNVITTSNQYGIGLAFTAVGSTIENVIISNNIINVIAGLYSPIYARYAYCKNIQIEGNYLYTSYSGVYFLDLRDCSEISVQNNIMLCGRSGVSIQNVAGYTVENVMIKNNNIESTGSFYAIFMEGLSAGDQKYIQIDGNTVIGGLGSVVMRHCEYFDIRDNSLIGTSTGVLLASAYSANHYSIKDNHFINCTTPIDDQVEGTRSVYEQRIDLLMDVLAVSATHVRSNEDLSEAIPNTFTITAQPDVPRTLSGHFDTHANITAYTIDIVGVDAKGNTVTETKTEADGWDWETSNAFATITSIIMSARTGTGATDTMDIGITDVLGLSNVIYETGDVFKIKKNTANATVAGAQVNTTYDTYDMSVITLGAGDDFTIWYKSNLNIIS